LIEWLIASGRDLGDIENKKGKEWFGEFFTILEIAQERNHTKVLSLLERFVDDPEQTRLELRILDNLAADIFAMVVFLCDDLLQLKPASHAAATSNPAAGTLRFFTIASKLPMELQMILCRLVVGSTKQNIIHEDSEEAFKDLAWILLSSSQED